MGGGASSEMVAADPKIARARELAARHREAREALLFYAALVEFAGDWDDLIALVRRIGPPVLQEAARRIDPFELKAAVDRYLRGEDRVSPDSFFARVMLRRERPRARGVPSNRCPECGEPPQCGVLRPQGDGHAFALVCSLCAAEWSFPRGQCPACGEADREKIAWFQAETLAHVQTQTCDACARYLHVIHCGKEPAAVPEVDEVASLAMDVWAREQGYEKIHPNLIGI